MDAKFNRFAFSIFIGCDFYKFSEVIRNHYSDWVSEGKCTIKDYTELNLEQYKDPKIGWHLEKFSWWESDLYSDTIFLSSNQSDGMDGLGYVIQNCLKCKYIACFISSEESCTKNMFLHIDSCGKERVVLALKEDRWTFFQDGDPLPFEDLSLYEKKRKKDRINMDVILKYIKEIGVDFQKFDTSVSKCSTLEQLK